MTMAVVVTVGSDFSYHLFHDLRELVLTSTHQHCTSDGGLKKGRGMRKRKEKKKKKKQQVCRRD